MNYENEIKNMKEYTYKWKPENYDKPNEPILKVSKSSLGSFDWCPKKYEFNYIQRLPQDTDAMLKRAVLHNHRRFL